MGQMVFSQPELICFRYDALSSPDPSCVWTIRVPPEPTSLWPTQVAGIAHGTVAARSKTVPETTLWPLPTVRGEGGLCCLPSHGLSPLNSCLVAFPIGPVVALVARPAPGTPTLSTQAL